MDAQEDNFFQPLFLGSLAHKYGRLQNSKRLSLVHYTSSSAFFEMLRNKRVWMRNARCMNDFREMTYALDLVRGYFQSQQNADRFKAVCEDCHQGVHARLNALLDGHLPSIVDEAYITCLSEHDRYNEPRGRLSMWRSYSGHEVAVAVYLRTKAIVGDGPYGLLGYPVQYWAPKKLTTELDTRIEFIRTHRDAIRERPAEDFLNNLFGMFQVLAAAVKHPAFKEEREWRLIYLPRLYPSLGMEKNKAFKTVNGMPQTIYEIPIDGKPFNSGMAISTKELIEKIVVGPCFEAGVAIQSVIGALQQAEHSQAKKIVSFCGIPYREKI